MSKSDVDKKTVGLQGKAIVANQLLLLSYLKQSKNAAQKIAGEFQ